MDLFNKIKETELPVRYVLKDALELYFAMKGYNVYDEPKQLIKYARACSLTLDGYMNLIEQYLELPEPFDYEEAKRKKKEFFKDENK